MNNSFLSLSLPLAIGVAIAVAPKASANMILDVQGGAAVQWTPNQLTNTLPARVGTTLEAGDRLSAAQGASAMVLCADGTIWKLTSGQSLLVESGCQSTAATDSRQVLMSNQDAANVEGYPYPTMPRFTLVPPKDFAISWNPVAGATSYKVQIGELFGSVWETQTKATSIKFDNSVALQPDVDYLVVVESDNGLSSTAASPPFGFRIATPAQLQEVQTKLTAVRNAGLRGDTLAIAEAGVYASGQFLADALTVLQGAMAQGSKNPALYAYAGKLYRFTGLSREAVQAYEQAIALANPEQDVELVTTASANLAQLTMLISRHDAAVLQARAALGYNELGETENAAALDDSLAIAANTSPNTQTVRGSSNAPFQSIITPQSGFIPGGEAAIDTSSTTGRIRLRGGIPGGEANQIPGGEFGIPGGEFGIPGGEFGIPGGEFGIPGGEFGIPGGEFGIPGGEANQIPPGEKNK